MPTTLFVLVNAVINAFRLVDHIVVMTRGGPDNATSLLLYYIYEIGFRFWDSAYAGGADDGAARDPRRCRARRSSGSSSAGSTTSERTVYATTRHAARARDRRRAGCSAPVDPAARLRVLDRVPSGASSRRASCSTAPLTLDNFAKAWEAAPFARYFVNTVLLVTMVLAAQLVLVTLAAYAFARFEFPGRDVLFALVLVQLMVMPDVLIVENYRTMTALGIKDTIVAIGLPYMASAFGIFLLRQTFKTVPRELDEAARGRRLRAARGAVEGLRAARAAGLSRLRARQRQLPLEQFPLAAHHHQFGGVAAADRRAAGVLVGRPGHRLVDHHRGDAAHDGAASDRVLLFQRQFVQSFMRAGIRGRST